MKSNYDRTNDGVVYTPRLLNWLLGCIGLVIVWGATHNWIAMLGAFIAGLHITIRVKP